MDYQSLLNSLEKICVLVAITCFLSRTDIFARLFAQVIRPRDKLLAFLFFSLLALTEIVLSPEKSPLNARIVAATAAGLLGGASVGVAVGMFTALVAVLVPGFGVSLDGLAAATGGLFGGLVCLYTLDLRPKVLAGFLVGAMSHMLWLGMVFAGDFLVASSWDTLVVQYGVPVLANGLAVALFLVIIGDMRAHQERIERDELARAISIANRVLPKLGTGLNRESAFHIAQTVRRLTGVAAAAIAGPDGLLAFDGTGSDHHSERVGPAASKCLADGVSRQIEEAGSICARRDCSLSAVRAAPLYYDGEIIGCVELYQSGGRRLGAETADLGCEIAQFLCNYLMQLAQLESQTHAISRAELKALQAQVHPHFLFNALNTIAALCELDPRKAGALIVKLGDFFRSTLKNGTDLLRPLSEEISVTTSYLEIERARFGDKLEVTEEIEPETEGCLVPSFSLQPLVENAVLHGLSKKTGPGSLRIAARLKKDRLVCWVVDDGRGFNVDSKVTEDEDDVHALSMLGSRLRSIYGDRFGFRIRSRIGRGTVVCLWIPATMETD